MPWWGSLEAKYFFDVQGSWWLGHGRLADEIGGKGYPTISIAKALLFLAMSTTMRVS